VEIAMNRTLALASAALALAACSPDFDPASKVDRLRVLAIQAEPAEIAPLDDPDALHTAALTSLVLRADFDAEPAPTTTVVYLACVPTPGDPKTSPCAALASLRDPTPLIGGAAQAVCDGGGLASLPIAFAGAEECLAGTCGPASAMGALLQAPEVAVPDRVDDGFAALRDQGGGPELVLGVEAVVLAFALDASAGELVTAGAGATSCVAGDLVTGLSRLWPSRDHVLSTKRVQIRGPDAPDLPNVNPVIDEIVAGATTLVAGAPTTLAGGTIALKPVLPADSDALHQTYTKLDAAGVPIETTTEEWVYSWFSTAGEIDELHTRGTAADEWEVYGTAGSTRAVVAAVVRDLRGGVDWKLREVVIAP
jgi:hypothetical protein